VRATPGYITGATIHVRGSARPNWGGGRSLLAYNSLGHDARPGRLARCAPVPGPSRLSPGGPGRLRDPRLACKAGGKRREPLAWWIPAARLSFSWVDWLAQPVCQIWHKIVSAVLHELFQLCFSRYAAPAITGQPKFPLARVLFGPRSSHRTENGAVPEFTQR
jgi:hypothetical protein